MNTTTIPPMPSAADEHGKVAEIVQRAIAAIGTDHPETDHILNLDQHARQLGPEASALRRILTTDPVVRRTQEEYWRDNDIAVKARRSFEFWLSLTIIVAVAALTLAIFLHAVPAEATALVRAGFAISLGVVLDGLLACFAISKSFTKKVGQWRARGMRTAVVAALAGALYVWALPEDFTAFSETMKNTLMVVMLVCIVVADFVGGGMTARLFRRRSMHAAWYEARGRAEANRRLLFMAVLNAEAPGDGKADPIPLLSQKLEYFRRYQIQVQQGYYEQKSKENARGAGQASWARALAFGSFVILFFGTIAGQVAKLSEQGSHWLPESWTGWLVERALAGWDDVILMSALLTLGTYGYLQLRSSLLREMVNHRRFGNALGQLRQASSATPAIADLKLPTPLAYARKAAVHGDRQVVEHIIRDVNRLLATEVGDWNTMTSFIITSVDNKPRLFSAEKLDAEGDFEHVTRELGDYGAKMFRARKISFVAARAASAAERIETRYNGKESHDTAQSGDWIATNMDTQRNIIRDTQNCVNTYVIRKETFERLYDKDHGTTDFGDVYKAKGVVDAIEVAGGFDIVAPWGERQQGPGGYLLRNGADVYGIHPEAFDLTYERVTR